MAEPFSRFQGLVSAKGGPMDVMGRVVVGLVRISIYIRMRVGVCI
jgi:hypothetical protein